MSYSILFICLFLSIYVIYLSKKWDVSWLASDGKNPNSGEKKFVGLSHIVLALVAGLILSISLENSEHMSTPWWIFLLFAFLTVLDNKPQKGDLPWNICIPVGIFICITSLTLVSFMPVVD